MHCQLEMPCYIPVYRTVLAARGTTQAVPGSPFPACHLLSLKLPHQDGRIVFLATPLGKFSACLTAAGPCQSPKVLVMAICLLYWVCTTLLAVQELRRPPGRVSEIALLVKHCTDCR
jgi:hypothetical protein